MRHVCAFMIASIVLCAQGAEAQTILRVDCTASDPSPDGSTWAKAYPHLQDALAAASGIAGPVSPVQVWVAECAYMPDGGSAPTGGVHSPGSGDRAATFQLINDVEIYGGFPTGGRDGTFDARDPDPETNGTVLSGDLAADDRWAFNGFVVPSDDCATAVPIGEGRTLFDTTDATLDGEQNYCIHNQDVWFLYTASCTGTLSARIGKGFGAAIYEAGVCPPAGPGECSQNPSVPATAAVTAGTTYLIRVGATYGAQTTRGFIDLMCEGNNTGENSYHVATGSGTVSSTVLDGFTVTGGNADGSSPDDAGGGLYSEQGSPTLMNCEFAGNRALDAGGAIYNIDGSPTITDCTFVGNSALIPSGLAYPHGGGIYSEDTTTRDDHEVSLSITRCTFNGNVAGLGGGGGIHSGGWGSSDTSSLKITDCTFTVNAGGNGGAVSMWSAGDSAITESTFTSNLAGAGGGVAVFELGRLAVTDCAFTDNWADGDVAFPIAGASLDGGGGGIFNMGARVALLRCRFLSNRTGNEGGAVGSYSEHDVFRYSETYTEIDECLFIGNSAGVAGSATGTGGAVAARNNGQVCITTLADCTFSGNLAVCGGWYTGGGAVANDQGNMTATNCTFTGNTVVGGREGGGAIHSRLSADTSGAAVLNCTFSGNSADVYGGAVFLRGGKTTNCAFVGNVAGDAGGGLFGQYSTGREGTVTNCTFAANSGGGIVGDPSVANCVLWGNTVAGGGATDEEAQIDGATTVNYSCIQGLSGALGGDGNIGDAPAFAGGPTGTWTAAATYDPTTGQTTFTDVGAGLTLDELAGSFLNPDTAQALQALIVSNADTTITTWGDFASLASGTETYEVTYYRLGTGSPCIDAGDNTADTDARAPGIQPLPAVDLDGSLRTVDDPATPNTGNPPEAAAIVDMGAYEFGSGALPSRLYVDASVPLGFSGTSWADAMTELRDALTAAALSEGAVTEIWVAAGTYTPAPPPPPTDPGGLRDPSGSKYLSFQLRSGLAVYGGFAGNEANLADRDLTDPNNETVLTGDLGGDDGAEPDNERNSLHVVTGSGTDATAVLDGCTVTAGYAFDWSRLGGWVGQGGGMENVAGSPTVINCLFQANWGGYSGGGMANSAGSSPTVINCCFRGNNAWYRGGGMVNSGGSNPTLINCGFVGNAPFGGGVLGPPMRGGGIANEDSSPVLVHCTLSRNAGRSGGGMYNDNSDPTLVNCVLWGNTDDDGSDESAQIHITSGTPVVTHSCIQDDDPDDGSIPFGGAANGNIDDDPLFVRYPDPGPDGDWDGVDDDYGDLRLLLNSPCIDAGDNTAVPADTADLDGDGDTSERTPLDLGGAARFFDHPLADDHGVPDLPDYPLIVDMGAHEYVGPRLEHICDGLGPLATVFISPKSRRVDFDTVDILVTEEVSLVGSCISSTGGAPPSVVGLTQLGSGLHAVQLSGPIELAEWTTVELTVAGDTSGAQAEVCFQIAHLPGDLDGNGQTNGNDPTRFGQLFPNGAVKLADLNGDGQVNLNDATTFGQIWNGTNGEGMNPDGTGGWHGEGLPARPACDCP